MPAPTPDDLTATADRHRRTILGVAVTLVALAVVSCTAPSTRLSAVMVSARNATAAMKSSVL